MDGSSNNGRPDSVLSKPFILERFHLENQVAIVTGGGQGIGRAFCHALAQAGSQVAVVDIQGDLAAKVAKELNSSYSSTSCRVAIGIQADVTNEADVVRMIHETCQEFGRFTIGVNNAGIGDWMAATDVSEDNWNKIINVNLKGVFLCCQAQAKCIIHQGLGGKIINVASMSASIVNVPQKQTVYNTTKAGVKHMTKSLAAEWAPHNIQVNSISPGYTQTTLVSKLLQTPQGRDYANQWIQRTPAKRLGNPTDLMGAIVYLASKASDFMTGHDLVIDGGYSCL